VKVNTWRLVLLLQGFAVCGILGTGILLLVIPRTWTDFLWGSFFCALGLVIFLNLVISLFGDPAEKDRRRGKW
jgi:uncharacterized membrane protein YfcA